MLLENHYLELERCFIIYLKLMVILHVQLIYSESLASGELFMGCLVSQPLHELCFPSLNKK